MKRICSIIAILFAVAALQAQNQQAIVKTRGKLNDNGNVIPGRGLAGAFVKIKDGNTHESKAEGLLSFPVPGGKYCIEKVTYVDRESQEQYQLIDWDELGRQNEYSTKPKDILVATQYEMNEDRLDEEMRAREVLMANYRKRQEEIKRLQAENQISREEAQRLRQQLVEAQANEEKLISDMAERYSKMDFDRLNDFDRQFAHFIRSGQLMRADSLLRTQGDLSAMEDTLRMLREENAAGREIIAEDEATLARKKAVQANNEEYEKQYLEKIADNYYKRYEIFSQQYQHDSAAYYLERRAILDTTRVEWQYEIGSYIVSYLVDYNKALSYFQRCLFCAKTQHEDLNKYIALSLNNIGLVFFYQNDFSQALSNFENALKIWESAFSKDYANVAAIHSNIGLISSSMGNYSQALSKFEAALKIQKSVFGKNHSNVALILNNIGFIYYSLGNYSQALANFEDALKIWESAFGKPHYSMGTSLNGIGAVYRSLGNYSQALLYYESALKIRKSVFGENHPDVAVCLNNIGSVYHSLGKYSQALACFESALKIRTSIFGEGHSSVAECFHNISAVYQSLGNYSQALSNCESALKISKAVFGENHPNVASHLYLIGSVYYSLNEYPQALSNLENALKIQKSVLGENHPDVGTSLNAIGTIYKSLGNFSQALSYYESALKIRKSIFGENHPNVVLIQNNIGRVYYSLGEYLKIVSEYLFTATILSSDVPAAAQGMSGEYLLLEYADWHQDCTTNLFQKNAELKGEPKSILVMKDGEIKRYHFENTIGAQLGLKYVGKEERERVNKAYNKWKKENEQ